VSEPVALVDSHCHLAEPDFDTDREAVLARAAAAGVTTLVCVGATGPVESNLPAVALTGRKGPVEIVATVGIHPHDASSADEAAFTTLGRLAASPGVVGIGETGLDFHYDRSPRPAQRAAFARTVALAPQKLGRCAPARFVPGSNGCRRHRQRAWEPRCRAAAV